MLSNVSWVVKGRTIDNEWIRTGRLFTSLYNYSHISNLYRQHWREQISALHANKGGSSFDERKLYTLMCAKWFILSTFPNPVKHKHTAWCVMAEGFIALDSSSGVWSTECGFESRSWHLLCKFWEVVLSALPARLRTDDTQAYMYIRMDCQRGNPVSALGVGGNASGKSNFSPHLELAFRPSVSCDLHREKKIK